MPRFPCLIGAAVLCVLTSACNWGSPLEDPQRLTADSIVTIEVSSADAIVADGVSSVPITVRIDKRAGNQPIVLTATRGLFTDTETSSLTRGANVDGVLS